MEAKTETGMMGSGGEVEITGKHSDSAKVW